MTKITGPFSERIQQWAAGDVTGGQGDPILSDSDIRDYLDNQVNSFGNLYLDEALVPPGATERLQLFTDEVDLMRHWVSSGLVYFDQNDDLIPNPMLHIVRSYDPVFDMDAYQVFIDEDTS